MNGEFDARLSEWRRDLDAALVGLYGDLAPAVAVDLVRRARAAHATRPQVLRTLDRERAASPHWYQAPDRIGYIAYVDRFGGDLRGVARRIPYLRQLGVNVLHLLSLLHPRQGENDGGYAVRDYLEPDPRLGTSDDLDDLIRQLRDSGISVCIDFVLNHTSDDHAWAIAAQAGSEYHRALYRTFPDRTGPDAWEATLPEIFPDLAPGNFTWDDRLERWVWTTFREFQWDLDWSNPDVMGEMFDLAAGLANRGVEILRLDAIAFTWKRQGTNCQNQPEAHLVAQAMRAALAMAAPATVLLAEAIVGPDDLVAYLGRHDHDGHERVRRECELAYHNQLMVQGWSMIASKRADLARHALDRLPQVPNRASWLTYVRCHDDIGWAIDDADAAAVGLSGAGHRAFLAAFYRGDFWRSFARGTSFGVNPDTDDERTSGMTSTLTGLAPVLHADGRIGGDGCGEGAGADVDLAVRRVLLLYGLACGYGGIPMIYMGDELGQGDDATWADDPARRADSRWTHRPTFDEVLAARRTDIDSIPGRLWAGITHILRVRSTCLPLHDDGALTRTFDPGSPTVFAWHRHHPRFGDLIGVANVGDGVAVVQRHPDLPGRPVDLLAPDDTDPWRVAPLQVRWVTADRAYRTVPAADVPPTAPPTGGR